MSDPESTGAQSYPDDAGRELRRGMSMFGLFGGGANVIMQLSRPGVGYGVVESRVDSGNLYLHPVKRTRTTLTYLAVALLGTDEERQAFRRAMGPPHAQVRSTPDSPVRYNAFDVDLQTWVAACLYRGFEDVYRLTRGPLGEHEDGFYQAGAVLGTTLQMPRDAWPADRAAFERYWTRSLEQAQIDDTVRDYLVGIATVTFLPRPLQVLAGPVNKFFTTGFLPEHFREQMRLPWGPRRQGLFDLFWRVAGPVDRLSPAVVRELPFRVAMWDLRRRIRKGMPLV